MGATLDVLIMDLVHLVESGVIGSDKLVEVLEKLSVKALSMEVDNQTLRRKAAVLDRVVDIVIPAAKVMLKELEGVSDLHALPVRSLLGGLESAIADAGEETDG